MEIKHVAFTSIIIMCLAVSYYYVIALPNQNKAKFELEKQKFELEKQKQQEREASLAKCRADVKIQRNKYIELNGTQMPGQPDVYTMTQGVREKLSQIERDGYQECDRMYGHTR